MWYNRSVEGGLWARPGLKRSAIVAPPSQSRTRRHFEARGELVEPSIQGLGRPAFCFVGTTLPADWLAAATYPVTLDPFLNDPFALGQSGSGTVNQQEPSVTFHETAGEYLAVWQDGRSGSNWDVYGQRVSITGSLVITNLALVTGTGDQTVPDVAYNGGVEDHFLAWQHGSGGDIYARRFYSDGTAAGAVITVTDTAAGERLPAVACRSGAGQCLVVWQARSGGYWDLFAQRVAGNGTLQGGVITVTAHVTASEKVADVAYRAGEGEYLVVWQDNHTGQAVIYARRVNVTGTLLGDVITVTAVTTRTQRYPAVAYNPDDDEYLVVWQLRESGIWSVHGRRLSGTGVTQGDNLLIASVSGYDNVLPAVAYDPRAGEYLVIWTYVGSGNGTVVYGRRVAADGTLLGDRFPVGWGSESHPPSHQETPAVAYGGQAHLIAWQDDPGGDWVIYGRQYGALVADFTATPLIGTVPLTVTLTDESTPWGTIDNYEWDYGDGVTSTTSAVTHSHVYTASGVYTVSLTVSRGSESDTLTRTNYVAVYPVPVTTIITYTYDPLYRLTSASYSSGEVYTYTYDEVGNRTAMTDATGVHTYTYDAANRLTSVDGVAYTWDDNGNLLSNGVFTFTYDAANRLITVTNGTTLTLEYQYNGDGVLVAQTADGVTTTFVQDVGGPLSQILVETSGGSTEWHLYGLAGVLAWTEDGAWVYPLKDALGSVRQLTGQDGQVDDVAAYSPFGVPDDGDSEVLHGYTGERWYGGLGLLYLRARWYTPEVGRFAQKDPWGGDYDAPLTLNRWNYVQGNPVNLADPSGHAPVGPACFAMCTSIVLLRNSVPPFLTVRQTIAICRQAYNQSSWKPFIDCGKLKQRPWSSPQTVRELFSDWLCERGQEHIRFGGTHPLTKELAGSRLLHEVRREFYRSGDIPWKLKKFGIGEYAMTTVDLPYAIVHFLGSFGYTVLQLPSERVGFRITNETERASGSHFRGRFRPQYVWSLEELVEQYPQLKNQPLSEVVGDPGYQVISVLAVKNRAQTTGPEGGGFMQQTFTWSERELNCIERMMLPWPVYLLFLDIHDWIEGVDPIPVV